MEQMREQPSPRTNSSPIEATVEAARRERLALLQQRDDLLPFMPADLAAQAGRTLGGVEALLREHPDLLTRLVDARDENPDQTVMLFIPGHHLVLSPTPTGSGTSVTALAPALTCTHSAMRAAFKERHERVGIVTSDRGLRIGILISDNRLEENAMEHTIRTGGRAYDFNPGTMNPADYIALAVRNFQNETFKAKFSWTGQPIPAGRRSLQ